jgi:hypothetical protein
VERLTNQTSRLPPRQIAWFVIELFYKGTCFKADTRLNN